jgi:hypothetical protein
MTQQPDLRQTLVESFATGDYDRFLDVLSRNLDAVARANTTWDWVEPPDSVRADAAALDTWRRAMFAITEILRQAGRLRRPEFQRARIRRVGPPTMRDGRPVFPPVKEIGEDEEARTYRDAQERADDGDYDASTALITTLREDMSGARDPIVGHLDSQARALQADNALHRREYAAAMAYAEEAIRRFRRRHDEAGVARYTSLLEVARFAYGAARR